MTPLLHWMVKNGFRRFKSLPALGAIAVIFKLLQKKGQSSSRVRYRSSQPRAEKVQSAISASNLACERRFFSNCKQCETATSQKDRG